MMTINNNNVYVHSSPPKAISSHGAAIRNWVKNGDLERLEAVILDGQGARLLGLMDSTSDPKVKSWLKSVPSYMAKVDLIHDAVTRGSLRETQALLDKRKLAIGRDAVGRGIAHKAVLYNHKSLVDWLGRKFPEVVQLRDNEGRTPLHYTAALQNPTDLYNTLVNLGCNPENADIHGRKALYYLHNPHELDIESPFLHNAPNASRSLSRNKKSSPSISPKGGSPSGGSSKTTSNSTPLSSSGGEKITRAQIRIWIHERDISKLEKIVWSGNGDKLLLETTNNSKVRRFLDNVPHLLSRIKQVHGSSVHNDLQGLKALKERPPLIEEVFTAKDQYGLTALHKAVGLGNRQIVEWLSYEFPSLLGIKDNEERGVLDYCRDQGLRSFLSKMGAEGSGYSSGEVDGRYLRNIPDAPRVTGEMSWWERGGSPLVFNNKRKVSSSGEFDTDVTGGRESSSPLMAASANKVRRTSDEEEEEAELEKSIKDVGEEYLNNNEEEAGKKFGLENGLERMEFELEDDEEEGGHTNELAKELERIEREEDNNEEELENNEVEMKPQSPEKRVESPEKRIESPQKRAESRKATPATPRPTTNPQTTEEKDEDEPIDAEKDPEKNADAENEAEMLSSIRPPTSVQMEEEPEPEVEATSLVTPTGNAPSSPQVPTENDVDNDIAVGNMEPLVNLVLDGRGSLLLEKTSKHPEVSEFLQNVPAYMAKIASIHAAANSGNMKDLQSLLDRKRLAQARDENGRVALHMAVLGGHAGVVRYLCGSYGQAINLADQNGRTPLHYAATLPDQGALYKVLIQAGADPNIKDKSDNTPGIYLRRKDLLKLEDLMDFNPDGQPAGSKAEADHWTRPESSAARTLSPSAAAVNNPSATPILGIDYGDNVDANRNRLFLLSSANPLSSGDSDLLELDPSQLQMLESFYATISAPESLWVRTWRRLTNTPRTGDIAKDYVKKYLSREVFDLVKGRCTPRYGATLLDCIKFYPQFFLIVPDPHAYSTFREVFARAVREHNGIPDGKEVVMQSYFGGSVPLSDIPIVDLPSKYISQVRIRISRNVRPYPFVSILRKEGLAEIEAKLRRHIQSLLDWERVDFDGMEKEERETVVEQRGVVVMEATKISRFWPKSRCCFINPDGSLQLWIHAQDHIDFIVTSRYCRLGPMLEKLKEIYDSVSDGLDYHWNSEVGFLTVDPFRCGTGCKITVRARLPILMRSRAQLTELCNQGHLALKWSNFSPEEKEIPPDGYVEFENTRTYGVDEVEIGKQFATSLEEVFKIEEARGREQDMMATGKIPKNKTLTQ